ncbi:MAG: hypothetical protein IJW83_03475 [Clostridia bacterium]|nr:hypothetical protein [Clostridia bacterium]
MANREFRLDKYAKTELRALPTAQELRESLDRGANAQIRQRLYQLFDENTFIETGAFTKRGFSDFFATDKSNELEGVICGYGAVDGKLVYAFAEDASRMGGAIDDRHAKKIADLYDMAIKNGAPVVGVFDSNGTDIFAGTSSLAAYARIMKCVAKASGTIPQIAFISGTCIGSAATIAAMFDFCVQDREAQFYVTSPELTGVKDAQKNLLTYVGECSQCLPFIRSLLSFLPENASVGADVTECNDNLNRMLGDVNFDGDAAAMLSAIADNNVYYELSPKKESSVSLAFTTVGGVKCGIVANSFKHHEGRICSDCAKKIARFVNFCDCFGIPLVTLVDSYGLASCAENEIDFADSLSDLAYAYATAENAKVTVICGHAIGASFALLGSKALGADIVYATDDSEIGALNAESGVAFAWDKYITVETTRDDLIAQWKAEVSSPVAAASCGEVDDIISYSELRARICSALLMLSGKGKARGFSY